jgi:hypothetical protein
MAFWAALRRWGERAVCCPRLTVDHLSFDLPNSFAGYRELLSDLF